MVWKFQAGSRSLVFGASVSGLGLVEYPAVEYAMSPSVFPNPNGDGSRFGKDFIPAQSVTLIVEARPDGRSLDAVWRELVAVWRADEVRKTPGARAVLEADTGRVTFGRPRPMSADFQHKLFDINRAELVFECVDDLWYGSVSETRIMFQVAAGGGLRFPARSPFRFTSVGATRNAAVQVEGDVATWPVFEIHGPVTNPEVEVQGVGRLVFNVNLAYDQFLRVDTRPWARWVKRGVKGRPETLAPEPGALSPGGSRLSDMSLHPGSYTVLLRGFDATGTAEMRVSTWPAYTSF